MSVNDRISNLLAGQAPTFIKEEFPTFLDFLSYYFRYLEQSEPNLASGKALNRAKTFLENTDIDQTMDSLTQLFYNKFMPMIPSTIIADKKVVMKNVLDFYRAKGTEKSIIFLINILLGKLSTIYYPKVDIFKASAAKYYIQKTLRVFNIKLNEVSDNSLITLQNFVSKQIIGVTSNATAIIEQIDRFIVNGVEINELTLSGISGTFKQGETISTTFISPNNVYNNLTAITFGGIINSLNIINRGTEYNVGDPVNIIGSGNGACVIVSSITTGNISGLEVVYGGAGFLINDPLIFLSGGGTGANGNVLTVSANNQFHPNTYTIYTGIISLDANTPLGNSVFSNLNSGNANTSLMNLIPSFSYGPCGPVTGVLLQNPGSGFSSPPTIAVLANSDIQMAGILGRMDIISGGAKYTANDMIVFTNPPGTHGFGANAHVTSVDGNGSIISVSFIQYSSSNTEYIGGSGYSETNLPLATVISANGTNANIAVTSLIGYGAEIDLKSTTLGSILSLSIDNGGKGYDNVILDLSQSGDGKATATANVSQGIFIYPGRFLNDDSKPSSGKYFQNRDYYQNYSYVIEVDASLTDYEDAIKILHPAGLIYFGKYIYFQEEKYTSLFSMTVNNINSNTFIEYPVYIS